MEEHQQKQQAPVPTRHPSPSAWNSFLHPNRFLPATLVLVALLAFGAHFLFRPSPFGSSFVGSVDDNEELEQQLDIFYDVPLTVLEKEDGVSKGGGPAGVCLDGSPPAYHFSPGFGGGRTKWVVFLEGGGWCTSLKHCQRRAERNLGSSALMSKEFRFDGIMSNSSLRNPYFFTWNTVYVRYCDGASFAGTWGEVAAAEEEGQASGSTVFFNGQAVFNRVMHHLMVDRGMEDATHALLGGCSAGGLASVLHCDEFAGLFKAGVTVKCMSDGGFFMDVEDTFGGRALRDMYSSVVKLQRPKMSKACLSSWPSDELSPDPSCFFPHNEMLHATTPMFMLNALYDNWCIDFAFVPVSKDASGEWSTCRADFKRCSKEQLASLNKYREVLVAQVKEVTTEKSVGSGGFLLGCHIHCQALWSNTWHGPTSPRIEGKTIAEAIGEWFEGTSKTPLLVDESSSNPTCYPWY